MRRKPHHYEDDLKRTVAEEVVLQGRKQSELCAEYGIRRQLISRWVDEYKAGVSWARGAGERGRDERLFHLERENKRLRQENEILKKASAYFAAHQK